MAKPMGIVPYINYIKQLYGGEQLVASVKPKPGWQHAPWQDYPADDDIPSVQKVAEGGRIYDTRKYFKPGGLVEPGVTHYGKFTEAEKAANLKTWMDNTGSTLEDYNKLPYNTRSNIRFGRITGIKQTAEFGKKLESAATKEFRNWLNKQDPKTLTADSVDDLIKQSKIKTTSINQRSGLVNAINRIMEEKEFSKFKNIQLGRAYSQENINQLSDDLLKAYAKDDITLVMDPKHKTSISDIRINRRSALDKAIKNTGLDEETIFNLLDDRDAYVALEKKQATTKGRPVEEGKAKFYKQAENWIIKNSKRYEDPDKFKKAFIRTFGKDNHLLQTINKGTMTSIPFSDWFRTTIMGTSEQAMRGQVKPTYTSSQLDTIFKTAIYTNNKNVRDKITKEIKNILPESASKRIPDIRKTLNESLLLKKFGINHEIKGPIARLLAKEIGDDLVKKISLFRKPWLGTPQLLTYLKDIVDPKYQSMFEESIKAIKYAQKNQWPEAKKALNLSQSIMFDHKIPKALIGLGYADEIEYIKLHPTSQQFNAIIKNSEFDKPLVKLTKKWAEAKTPDAKAKVVREMNELKDNFSKKYGGYLDEVKITLDKITGKPMFSSTAEVVTKKTDLPKLLKTSLAQEKGYKSFDSFQNGIFDQAKKAGIGLKCGMMQGGGSYTKCMQNAIDTEVKLAKSGGKGAKTAAQRIGGVAKWAGKWFGLIDIPFEFAFALPSLVRGDIEGAKQSTTFGLLGWGKTELEQMQERNPEAYKFMKHYDDTMNHFQLQWQKNDLEKKLEGFKTTGTYGQDVKDLGHKFL